MRKPAPAAARLSPLKRESLSRCVGTPHRAPGLRNSGLLGANMVRGWVRNVFVILVHPAAAPVQRDFGFNVATAPPARLRPERRWVDDELMGAEHPHSAGNAEGRGLRGRTRVALFV